MHSSLVRAQNVFGFFTTVVFFVAALVGLSSLLLPPEAPKVDRIGVRNVRIINGRAHQYYTSKIQEYAFINFDLDADLEPLFNWNTKQVFAYISASYPGSKYVENEAVIWDRIITSSATSKLFLTNERSKYNINDVTGKLAKRDNVTLSFHWNVQPHVGAMTWGSAELTQGFKFPALEVKGGKKPSS